MKVTGFGFIGGRYGNSNHYNMMKDLKENGPIIAGVFMDSGFTAYSEGTYIPKVSSEWSRKGNMRPTF